MQSLIFSTPLPIFQKEKPPIFCFHKQTFSRVFFRKHLHSLHYQWALMKSIASMPSQVSFFSFCDFFSQSLRCWLDWRFNELFPTTSIAQANKLAHKLIILAMIRAWAWSLSSTRGQARVFEQASKEATQARLNCDSSLTQLVFPY